MKEASLAEPRVELDLAVLDSVAHTPAGALAWTWSDISELTKVRVGLLVVFTTLAGYALASKLTGGAIDLARLAITLLGTSLVAGSAAASNQILEREADGRMHRTRNRPLPAARLSLAVAGLVAGLLLAAGAVLLFARINAFAGSIALLTWFLYVCVYTPLKQRTHLSTVIGAVPGALPPLIGWAAAGAALTGQAWWLFGVLFFWQLPHFLAIAWLYREDYARGGFPLLTVLDSSGNASARQGVLNTLALIAVSLLPCVGGQTSSLYALIAVSLGSVFLASMIWLATTKSTTAARAAILTSIAYLPLLLVAMVVAAPPA